MSEIDHLDHAEKLLTAAQMQPKADAHTAGLALAVMSIAHSLVAILQRTDSFITGLERSIAEGEENDESL